MSPKLERIIEFHPAYDKRHPKPSKNFGIHGVNCLFVLKGKKGAVQFLIYTNWHLPHVQKEMDVLPLGKFPYLHHKPQPADLGYHSLKPMHEGDVPIRDSCEWLDGKPCYYDGSTLNAEAIFKILVEKGSDGVWEALEDYYKQTFKEKE